MATISNNTTQLENLLQVLETKGTASSAPVLQGKSVTPSKSIKTVICDAGYDGLSIVEVGAIATETKTTIPSATDQTVKPSSGKYLSQVIVKGDSNLIASNIRKGVTIFNVTGTIDTEGSDENAAEYLARAMNKELDYLESDLITTVPGKWQYQNQNLISISLPNAVGEIPDQICTECSNLKTANFKSCTNLTAGIMGSCSSLKTINVDSVTTFSSWGYNFNQCRSLERIDFPSLTGSISAAAFHTNRNLTAVILRANSVVTLDNTNAFKETPIALYNGDVGYIYVPRALVDSYKAATNWSAYANQIRAIEDYPSITDRYCTISYEKDGEVIATIQGERWMLWHNWLISEYNTGEVTPVFADDNKIYSIIVNGEQHSLHLSAPYYSEWDFLPATCTILLEGEDEV